MYPREEEEEEEVQETERELSLSKMEDEIQEEMMEDSEEEGGAFLDLTTMDQGGVASEVERVFFIRKLASFLDI